MDIDPERAWRLYRLGALDAANDSMRGLDAALEATRSDATFSAATESKEERLYRELMRERIDKARIIAELSNGRR